MNKLQIFEGFGSNVRAMMKDGKPWFVVTDICNVLEIGNPSASTSTFPKTELRITTIDTNTNGTKKASRKMLIVNEPGLYRLIFQSRKKEAEKFKDWIFNDVIPSIRATGKYDIKNKRWAELREDGKVIRKRETDIIKAFIAYAEAQGSSNAKMYYVNFTKMVNAALLDLEGKKYKSVRDELNEYQVSAITIAETLIAKTIVECMAQKRFYKDVYKIAKDRISVFALSIGKSRIGETHKEFVGLIA